MNPTLLKRCNIVIKGKTVSDDNEKMNNLSNENIWWVLNTSAKQFLSAYYSERYNSLKELSLTHCIKVWGYNPIGVAEDDNGSNDATLEYTLPNGSRIFIPAVSPKYCDFVRRRNRIFREIRNMRKISSNTNVIRLDSVLELIQESKLTIFLVMELANGGELFDRIKIDYGTREDTAKLFFQQLLEGVHHCHKQGVCHRDLKPENLLLQDTNEGTILKIADFGFSARFIHGYDISENRNDDTDKHSHNRVIFTGMTPPVTHSFPEDSPMRALKSIVGSPFYVAPEVLQANPRGYDGPKADIWSLGVILYAMLAGNLPFEQDLASCKRFRLFCKWVREQSAKGIKFWDDSALEYPPWLFPAKFSTRAKGLIVAMLHPDPEYRISIAEAMTHPLVKTESTISTPTTSASTTSDMVTTDMNLVDLKYVRNSNVMEIEIVKNDSWNESSEHAHSDIHDDGNLFEMEDIGSSSKPIRKDSISSMTNRMSISDSNKLPPLAPIAQISTDMSDLIKINDDEDEVLLRGAARSMEQPRSSSEVSPTSGGGQANPPNFSDLVKRSTRFMTAVPAAEVLDKFEQILEEYRFKKTQTPIGLIGKIELHWEIFRLEVWGSDTNGPPLCALQLYLMPPNNNSPVQTLAISPGSFGQPSQSLYMVEFIRGQLEIFAFKRFYESLRQKISELVKRDYAFKLFDQAASPLVESFLRRQFEDHTI